MSMSLLSIKKIHVTNNHGFTIAEMIVCVVALGLFFSAALQWYLLVESQRVMLLKETTAGEVANINLKKFPTRPAALTICSTDANGIDLKSYNSYQDETTTTYPSFKNLGASSGVSQSVKGFPVDGCNGTNFVSSAFKIVSTVTYRDGFATRSVQRATIVNGVSVVVAPTYRASTLYWGPAYDAPANGGYTSMAMPAHSAGDILLVFLSGYVGGYGGIPSNAAPATGGTVPVWNEIPGGTNGGRMWWARATASNHTSGSWYTMEGWIQYIVSISGAVSAGSPIGGVANSSATNVAPAITLTNTDGSSMVLTLHRLQDSAGGGTSPTMSNPPSGYTLLAGGTWVSPNTMRHSYGIIRKNDGSSDGSYTFGTPNFSISAGTVFQVEIKSR